MKSLKTFAREFKNIRQIKKLTDDNLVSKSTPLYNGLLCLGVFVVLFCLLELYIRQTQPIALAYNYADCCDYVLKPNQKFSFSKKEFDSDISINGLGLRGQPPDLDKPLRILILGDSFAFGFGVNDDESFPARLEQLLRKPHQVAATVINAGHSGYDTRRELGFLQTYGPHFSPNIVLIAFVLNDVLSNSGKLWFNAIPDGWLRYFPLRGTATFLSYLIRNPSELMFKLGFNDDYPYTGNDALECLRSNGCTEDWQVTELFLKQIVISTRSMNANPVFVHIPVKEEILQKRGVAPYDLDGAEKRLQHLSNILSVPMITLRNHIRAEDYYPLDSHWTAANHERAAAKVAKSLLRLGRNKQLKWWALEYDRHAK